MNKLKAAADALEAAWRANSSTGNDGGALFNLRYSQFEANELEALTTCLRQLPSSEEPIPNDVQCTKEFRRFVRYAWAVPMYLERKKTDLISRNKAQEPQIRATFDRLRREIQRILGMHEFGS